MVNGGIPEGFAKGSTELISGNWHPVTSNPLTFIMFGRNHAHLKTVNRLVTEYDGSMPFPAFLRNYFSQNKKHGSNDRKTIAHLCYIYFRTGLAFADLSFSDRMAFSLFLCSNNENSFIDSLKPKLNRQIELPAAGKMQLLGDAELWKRIFPFPQQLSKQIDAQKFALAHLVQPPVFLRVRPPHLAYWREMVSRMPVPASFIDAFTLEVPQNVNLATYFQLNREVVVQDYSSQQTGELFRQFLQPLANGNNGSPKKPEVLDACAASGGKSILVYDMLNGEVNITVNDVRETMLHNCKNRLQEAGIEPAATACFDLSVPNPLTNGKKRFDAVIADVPCSGSGTWARTPENLVCFKEEKIAEYVALQRKILAQLVNAVAPGGFLFYITCSVYAAENEEAAAYIQQCGFEKREEKYFTGYASSADTMFGMVFCKLKGE